MSAPETPAALNHATSTTWRHSIVEALLCFLISRLIVFGIWITVGSIHVLTPPHGATFGDSIIVVDSQTLSSSIRTLATYNDAGWYRSIAVDGYEQRRFDASRQSNWAFFPLHPMLWHLATDMLGDEVLAGIILANTCLLLGLILVHRLSIELHYDAIAADGAVLFLAFCPTSYFFSLPWSESLFLLLTVATFFVALKEKWGLVFAFGAAACACRFIGLFLMPGLILWLWPRRGELPIRSWLAVGFMPLGLFAFMSLLWRACGNPLAFVDIQQTWGRHLTIPYKAFGVVLVKPYFLASDWNLRPLNFLAFACGVAACYWLVRHRKEFGLATFLGLGLLAPAMTGSLTSMARYSFALFPLAIAAGQMLRKRDNERIFLVVSAALLALLTLAFQEQFAFAGA